MGHAQWWVAKMTCGYVRLICEEPTIPPEGQQGKPLVIDVKQEDVAEAVKQLQADGWQTISEWPL
jgi:hypothetical protein